MVLQRLDDLTYADKVARAGKWKALLVLSLLPVLACIFVTPCTAIAQSTADVCRETQKVLKQYERESTEGALALRIKIIGQRQGRSYLSDLRRAAANGFVVSNLYQMTNTLGLVNGSRYISFDARSSLGLAIPNNSTKDRLAFQKNLLELMEKAVQLSEENSHRDLELKADQVGVQQRQRNLRLTQLDCDAVLARETSSAGNAEQTSSDNCQGFAGRWNTNGGLLTIRLTGNSAAGDYNYQGPSTISGTVSGNILEGNWSQPQYPDPNTRSGRMQFTLSPDGRSFSGKWWDATGADRGAWSGTRTGCP